MSEPARRTRARSARSCFHLSNTEVIEMLAQLEPDELQRLLDNTRARDEDSYQRLRELMRRTQN